MSRYPIILLLACMAALGSLVAALATIQARDDNLRGYANAAPGGQRRTAPV
jgi:hypothetical protein